MEYKIDKLIKSNQPCFSEKCGSSDGLAIYFNKQKGFNAFCFSCKTYFPSIEKQEQQEKEEEKKVDMMSETIDTILRSTVISEIPERGLSKETCEFFGIRVSFNTQTGEIDRHYYPYYDKDGNLIAFKCRLVDKKSFYIVGDIRSAVLFNQHKCGSGGKFLILTEGEIDAASAFEILKTRGKRYRIVSLINGANKKGLNVSFEWLNSFGTVCFALDQDEVGKETALSLASQLNPGASKILSFSEKDINDLLVKGKEAEFFNSLFNAKSFKPDGIVGVDDVYEEAIKPISWGFSWPWETLTNATYGYRWGEIYGIGGASGGGKTEYCKEVINHIITEHKRPVGVIFLEEPVTKTLKVLAGKKFNKRFHIPDGDWTIDELKEGISDLKGKVYLYNHFGSKDWESIKSKIRYMVIALGIKEIVLDHLTALVAQEENEYKALNRIMEDMSSLVEELNFTLFYVSHLRKKAGTMSHEEGGRVSADEFKGSGAIIYWSHFLFGIERNQQAEDFDDRNTTTFRVLKDRNTGLATGTTFQLWYDHKTGKWREKKEEDYFEEL